MALIAKVARLIDDMTFDQSIGRSSSCGNQDFICSICFDFIVLSGREIGVSLAEIARKFFRVVSESGRLS